jgi:hypothetical protein
LQFVFISGGDVWYKSDVFTHNLILIEEARAMLIARLHFDNGSEVEQPISDGQTVPYRLKHVEDKGEDMIVRTFGYRAGQPAGDLVIHYDELSDKTESVRKQGA